jgi:hypothetical protein
MAITSQTDICNLALDLLNAGTVQDTETPTTPTEELLNRWYDQSRKKILREHPWNFAIKRELLAASSTAPEFGYSTAFPLPSDFVRLVALEDGNGGAFTQDDYALEDGNVLLSTDATSLRMVYIYNITNVTQFDPMFIDLLALEIALSVAYKITTSNTNVERLASLHKQRGALARAIDGQERPPVRRERSRSITARQMGRTDDTTRIRF